MAQIIHIPISCAHRSVFNRFLHSNPNFTKHFLSLLSFCRNSRDLKALNSRLIVNGLTEQSPLLEKFISHCCRLGFPDVAITAFKTTEKRSLSLQNLILRSLCDKGLFENVISVYRKCQSSGFLSDNHTYPFVIKACAALGDVCFGRTMHSVVLRTGFGENLVVQTALVDFYSKTGDMGNARKLFDEISHPDLVVWNTLISGCSFNGIDNEVFRVFRNMHAIGVKPNTVTFAVTISVCSRFDVSTNFGMSLHGLAYKLGYSEAETLFTPGLISMYANRGHLAAARTIFDASTSKSVAAWNAMISAYKRNQEPENASAIFRMMRLSDVEPNILTLVSLLPFSENLGGIQYVGSLHAYTLKLGFEKKPAVTTALLSLYAKLGIIESAEILFQNNNLQRNLLLWNSMVSAYACNELWERSLEAFCHLQMDGFCPDSISVVSLLSTCTEIRDSLSGRSAHAFTLKNGTAFNLNVSNALLAFYCNCGELAYSFRIFNGMVLKDVVSWNTMISGCVNNGEPEKVVMLFHEMSREGMNFDSVTLISILSSCHDCQNRLLGLAVHSYAIRTNLIIDTSLANALISMYINFRELEGARLLLDDMPYKSVVSYNVILTGYRHHCLHKEAFELFHQMIDDDQRPNYVTLLNLLPLCRTFLRSKQIHAYILRRRIQIETPLLTSLMITYARFEKSKSCLILFDTGDKRSISLWNAVISAHLVSRNSSMAFFFFLELLRYGIKPDKVTVLNLVSACVHLNNLWITDAVFTYLLKKGFDKDVVISNALIDLYAKCGKISMARTLFNFLQGKDTISWSTMINAYGLHGDVESALTLYSRMRIPGLKPDKATYTSILSACSHAGFVEQARMIFDHMMCDGVSPGVDTYSCVVDLLGRKGYLKEAYEIIKVLPEKTRVNLLDSLLGACLSHGNYGLGEEIGGLLVELNSGESGPYVKLYNTYVATGKWLEADNVRLAMEQRQFSKAPGMSLLDGDMYIHK